MPELLDATGKPVSSKPDSDLKKDDASKSSASPEPDSRYARAEDVAKLADRFGQVSDTLSRLEGYVQGAGALAPQPTAPTAPEPVITDEDINRAIAEGENPAGRIRAMIDRAVTKTAELAAERIKGLEEYGSSNFAAFAEAQARNWPNFKRFEKEIRAEIDKVNPQLKGNPQAWEYAYNIVRGRHADELANEAAEEAIRRAKEEAPPSLPGSQVEPPKLSDGSDVPTPADLGGQEAVAALRYRGLDQERYAQGMGYASWADYIEKTNVKDPYENDEWLFPKGKSRGPSFTRRARA